MGAEVVLPDGEVVHLGGTAPEHPGLRPARRLRRQRGHARRRDRGDGAHDPGAGVRADDARRLPHRRGRRRRGQRHHRRRHPAGRHRDDGRARHRGRRGGRAVRLPRRRRRGARHRARRAAGRGRRAVPPGRASSSPARDGVRDAHRAGRRRAGAHVEGPQVRLRRRRPHQPGLLRAGRRHPAHPARPRCSATIDRDGRATSGCASPTSSTPATATCTRWSCSTTPSTARPHDAEELAGAILDLCVDAGGSITGEHGVGHEKKAKMARQFSADDLDTMQLVRCAFDPDGISNPGKVFPTPRLCGERPGIRTAADTRDPALRRGVLTCRPRPSSTAGHRRATPSAGSPRREVVRPATVEEVAARAARGRRAGTHRRAGGRPQQDRLGRSADLAATCCST